MNKTTGAINFTWVTFVQALKNAFDDPDAYQTAGRKLEALKQERNDCSPYLSSFTPLATTLNLDQRTKIAFFRKGLNRELQTALSYNHNLPDVFDEFVQICIKLDNQIRVNRDNQKTQGQNSTNVPNNTNISTSTGTQPGPMDLSAVGRTSQKRGPLTAAEKKRRRDNSLCLYCGSPGHWATTCPQKKRRTAASAVIAENDGGIPLLTSPTPAPTINSAICVSPAQILYKPKNY